MTLNSEGYGGKNWQANRDQMGAFAEELVLLGICCEILSQFYCKLKTLHSTWNRKWIAYSPVAQDGVTEVPFLVSDDKL
ncbi:MAG: hypothetical protein SFY66_15895 [Oculatellaceae cyanobacterium bins.114]|nr:hypothetical protein [Oculatellaceae cyanobacterium bins.114]